MLLKIYELITNLQTRLGNDAHVELSAKNGFLIIRIDWTEHDMHAEYVFSYQELKYIQTEEALIIALITRYGGGKIFALRTHVAAQEKVK